MVFVYINECIDVNTAFKKFLQIYEFFWVGQISFQDISYAGKPQVVSSYILSNLWRQLIVGYSSKKVILIHNNLIFFVAHWWAQYKLECHIILVSDTHSCLLDPFVSYKENVVNMEPYSQHFVFFVTYEWTWEARVLQNTTLERLAREKHSSLFRPFVIYEKIMFCEYGPWFQGPYSQHVIFFVTNVHDKPFKFGGMKETL
jgi:hypothetical protein